MCKVVNFLSEPLMNGSFLEIVRSFLVSCEERGLSHIYISSMFYTLSPYGIENDNPLIADINRRELRIYINDYWNRFAPGSVNQRIGHWITFSNWLVENSITDKPLVIGVKKRNIIGIDKSANVNDVRKTITYLNSLIRPFMGSWVFDRRDSKARRAVRNLFLITIAYESGARRAEFANMRHVDLLSVIRKPPQSDNVPVWTVPSFGKTDNQMIRFSVATKQMIELWDYVRPDCSVPQSLVSMNGKLERLKPEGVGRIVRRCSDAAGANRWSLHQLRHLKGGQVDDLFDGEIGRRVLNHSGRDVFERHYASKNKDIRVRQAIADTRLDESWLDIFN